ncbi:MAG: helicase HerA domain-containing protein [Planctomycetota bacterium]
MGEPLEPAPVPSGRSTLSTRLTENFYAWERRGRGWTRYPYPVPLEPPFRPFFHAGTPETGIADDGRRPGVLERVFNRLRSGDEPCEVSPRNDENEDVPEHDDDQSDRVELRIRIPQSLNPGRDLAERMILALSGTVSPVSFELVGLSDGVILQFACRTEDVPTLKQVLEAFVPEASVEETPGFLEKAWSARELGYPVIADFGLSREFMLPIDVPRSFEVDPVLAFVSALDGMDEREIGVLQVLFARTSYPWAESIARAITDGTGGAFFIDAPETASRAKAKISRPLFACVVRIGVLAATETQAWKRARNLGNALAQFANPASNEFVPLENDFYTDTDHARELILRRTRRSGMILASDELASIVHLPSPSVHAPGIRGQARKTKRAPEHLAVGDVVLGENADRGKTRIVRLPSAMRLRHLHVIGATGSGKSTLMRELMRQDLEAGRGIGLLDPHGDLADEVLALVPDRRRNEVVLFDPADEEAPVGFNVLGARSERERELLESDLVAVFRRFSTSWGDQMTAVLGNAILALLESPKGGTLLDLRRFLTERGFRGRVLATVHDPAVRSFWDREFPLLKGTPQTSILTRLDQFLRPRSVRRVVAERENKLDLASIVHSGGIFIGKLSQGAIGEENAHLLGSLLVAKFQQVALARERLPETERHDFFLYLDEFHHFVTPSLGSLLAGARKYHVGLVLAHQELRQLGNRELESALLTNAGTRVCFRLGDEDARKLAEGFTSFDARDLQSLGTGEAIVRVERADHDFSIRVRATPRPESTKAAAHVDAIRSLSRSRWGTPREEVDRVLAAAYGEAVEPRAEKNEVTEGLGDQLVETEPRVDVPGPDSPTRQLIPRPPKPAAARTSKPPVVRAETAPGRGGAKHKYLQTLIKRYAEERGYRARLEAVLPEGGRVDVLLERGGASVACEISIASTPEQELGNIEKCLTGGCGRVVVVSPERRTLRKVETLVVSSLPEAQHTRISYLTPEELLAFIDEQAATPETREGTVLGYKVRTSLSRIAPEEQAARQESIVRTIVRSLRKMKAEQ